MPRSDSKPVATFRTDNLVVALRRNEIHTVRGLANFIQIPHRTLADQIEHNRPTMPVAAALARAFDRGLDTFISILDESDAALTSDCAKRVFAEMSR